MKLNICKEKEGERDLKNPMTGKGYSVTCIMNTETKNRSVDNMET